VLFADPAVGRFFKHDSPYTYFTSGALHLGEISLECSRAGAAAAALWATLQLFPLTPGGLGAVLAASRRAARVFADLVERSARLRLYQRPELDVVTYFPAGAGMAAVDATSQATFERAMTAAEPVFVGVTRVRAEALARRHPALAADGPAAVRILRSVLMKPEHEPAAPDLVARLEAFAGP
jgi:glutamate/tyrosine decarboxylase-like PLP-dependent enzyme